MTNVRIRGFKIFRDRHGRMRCYHRETGQKIDLAKAPLGSAAFLAECEKIAAIATANKARAPKVGTLGGLIQSYYETEHFRNLSPTTRRDYRQCAGFLEPIRDTPVHALDTPLVAGNLAAKNRETMATLESENARRARIVKPSGETVKPKPKEALE